MGKTAMGNRRTVRIPEKLIPPCNLDIHSQRPTKDYDISARKYSTANQRSRIYNQTQKSHTRSRH
eukprot:11306377-Ditylum_brightwellii.AAC.1